MNDAVSPFDVLEFWWQAGPAKWWVRNDKFDQSIKTGFGETHRAAAAGALDFWAGDASGALALILVLDQFSRNLKRQSAEAFAQDPKALELALAAIDKGYDRAFPELARAFFYMPLMHAEDMAMQDLCLDLCRQHCGADTYRSALEHMDIIRRFGRFPHRNTVLGRVTTEAEQRFLDTGGFKG